MQFLKINEELCRDWPVITEIGERPGDADQWANVPDKLKLLEK